MFKPILKITSILIFIYLFFFFYKNQNKQEGFVKDLELRVQKTLILKASLNCCDSLLDLMKPTYSVKAWEHTKDLLIKELTGSIDTIYSYSTYKDSLIIQAKSKIKGIDETINVDQTKTEFVKNELHMVVVDLSMYYSEVYFSQNSSLTEHIFLNKVFRLFSFFFLILGIIISIVFISRI